MECGSLNVIDSHNLIRNDIIRMCDFVRMYMPSLKCVPVGLALRFSRCWCFG